MHPTVLNELPNRHRRDPDEHQDIPRERQGRHHPNYGAFNRDEEPEDRVDVGPAFAVRALRLDWLSFAPPYFPLGARQRPIDRNFPIGLVADCVPQISVDCR